MNEKTLVFVKPRNEDIVHDVFAYLDFLLGKDEKPFRSFESIYEIKRVPESLIAEHYSSLKKINEDIFRATIEAYKTGTMFLTFYSGENIVERVRTNIGDKDPMKAEPWTIRGRFKRDSLEDALREKRYCNNVIHASSDLEEADRELNLWLPYLIDLTI